jgi:hypothetical protein
VGGCGLLVKLMVWGGVMPEVAAWMALTGVGSVVDLTLSVLLPSCCEVGWAP